MCFRLPAPPGAAGVTCMGHHLKGDLHFYKVVSCSTTRPRPGFIVGLGLDTASWS